MFKDDSVGIIYPTYRPVNLRPTFVNNKKSPYRATKTHAPKEPIHSTALRSNSNSGLSSPEDR